MQEVVAGFEHRPDLTGLPPEDVERITSLLPLDLDIELAGTHIRCGTGPVECGMHFLLPSTASVSKCRGKYHVPGLFSAKFWRVRIACRSEEYWRRRSQKRWKNCMVSSHGNSWKQLYFECNLQDTLEQFDPTVSVVDELRRCASRVEMSLQ